MNLLNIFRTYLQSCGQLAAAKKMAPYITSGTSYLTQMSRPMFHIALITEGYAKLAVMQLSVLTT